MCVHCSCGDGECQKCTAEYKARISRLENEVVRLTAFLKEAHYVSEQYRIAAGHSPKINLR